MDIELAKYFCSPYAEFRIDDRAELERGLFGLVDQLDWGSALYSHLCDVVGATPEQIEEAHRRLEAGEFSRNGHRYTKDGGLEFDPSQVKNGTETGTQGEGGE